MRMRFIHRHVVRRGRIRRLLSCALLAALTPLVSAAPPIDPLPAPNYSFDLVSPTVLGGIVDASDVLAPGAEHPQRVIFGPLLGLAMPEDDLDALSGANANVSDVETFVLLFSVDRQTMGTADPDPLLIELEVPYNALDQAWRGQAAGDQFMSLPLFTRQGRERGGPSTGNSTLNRNNYDEGGTDFTALPATHASDFVGRVPQDNVDATGRLAHVGNGRFIVDVYFSATTDSPSLFDLSGTAPSGADIFYNPNPLDGAPTTVFATHDELGLAQADDIDAMIIFDDNIDGRLNGTDRVVFSLTPDSPSLAMIPGASPFGPGADVFFATIGGPPILFAAAADIGLGTDADNVDALDFSFCMDSPGCASINGIRALRGDLNCDDLINAFDIDPFVLALANPEEYMLAFPWCDIIRADVNFDGAVNAFDIDPFVLRLTGG